MDDHTPKTEADYRVFMECVKDYIVFLEKWIEENRVTQGWEFPRVGSGEKTPIRESVIFRK